MKRFLPTLEIRHKLVGFSFALVGAVVVALSIFLSGRHFEVTRANLEARARVRTELLARATQAAVASGDAQTTRDMFDAAATDPDVQALALVGPKGELLASFGETSVALDSLSAAAAAAEPASVAVRRSETRITCIRAVVTPEGPRGVLVLEMSTASIAAERKAFLRTAFIGGLIALVAGFIVSWFLGSALSRRLRRIQTAAQAVARGKLDAPPVVDTSSDEIGRLARDFNVMATRLNAIVDSISMSAADEMAELDRVVATRTSELTARNGDLRFLLDNVGQGFVTVDRSGKLSQERSAVMDRWFGKSASEDEPLWKYIGRHDERAARWLEVGWDTLIDDLLPLELAVDQLPKQICAGHKIFAIEYRPVMTSTASADGGAASSVSNVIVVISDVTAEVARQRAEAAQKEHAGLFGRFVRDRASVAEFFHEAAGLMTSIVSTAGAEEQQQQQQQQQPVVTLADRKRAIHTLKGNAGFFGLERIAACCHRMETELSEAADESSAMDEAQQDGAKPMFSASSREELMDLWSEVTEVFVPLVGTQRDIVEVGRADMQVLIAKLRAASNVDALRHVEQWSLERMEQRLGRVAEQARSFSRRLDKPEVNVTIEANDVKLDAQEWGPFWAAFVHVVRNAVDHGVEDRDTREACGKMPAGMIALRVKQSAVETIVEIEDDGRGIDWGKLRTRAKMLGLSDDVPPEELLFAEGVSTREEVTESSGRGVGLAASRAACFEMGGRVDVITRIGAGTCFRFRVPRRDVPESWVSTLSVPPPTKRYPRIDQLS